jgi:transcription initiation factor TFIIB
MVVSLQKQKSEKCPECGSVNILHDSEAGEYICGNCGLVLHEHVIDRGPEWRAFKEEKITKRVRVGAPLTNLMHDQGLSTEIDARNYDAYGRPIPYEIKSDIYRLRKLQKRAMETKEKTLALGLSNISRWCNHLALPEHVAETAALTYRKAWNQGITRGRHVNELSAASVYFASRQCGATNHELLRTLKEIEDVSGISRKKIGKSYRLLLKNFDYLSPKQRPEGYVSKILKSLGITGQTEKIVYKTLAAAREAKLTSGKGPVGRAAAACYIASTLTGERRTQAEIAEIANVTEVTIRNRSRDLMKELMFEVYL